MLLNRTRKIRLVIDSIRKGNQFIVSIHTAGIRSTSTWYNWEKATPRLKLLRAAAQEICSTKRVEMVTDALFKKACGGDVGACAFYLKNKAGWKDSPQVVVETGTQIKTPHAVIFSAVREECHITTTTNNNQITIPVKDECLQVKL